MKRITGMNPKASCGVLYPPLCGIVQLTNSVVLRTQNWSFTIIILILIAGVFFASPAIAGFRAPSPDKIKYPLLQFNLPHAERIVLENGIVIYILEDHELPLVNINALIKTGTMYDPAGKEGVADLTAYLLKTGGSQKLSSSEIDKLLDLMAASLSIKASVDSAQIDFSLLNTDFNHGLDLLAQILITPAFEQKKFDLAKELKMEDLRRLKDDPQRLAFREFSRVVFPDNPRGRSSSLKSLKNIERNDLLEFHRRFFQPQNLMFAITGDITKSEAISKIRSYFGNWQNASVTNIAPPPPPHYSQSSLYFINKEIPQTTIIEGNYAPGKKSPDFFSFTVLDFIIGSGGFPSRIFSAVRNNEGLAYSAGSTYRPRPEHGLFAAYAFTKTESTLKTLSLIDSVLDKSKAHSITLKEIAWAKKSINNGFIFSFTTAENIAWQQLKIEYEQLPADYLLSYRKNIDNVNVADINKTAVKYLNKNYFVTLILGNTRQFEQTITGYGPPVIINPQD
jgi:zinc protease